MHNKSNNPIKVYFSSSRNNYKVKKDLGFPCHKLVVVSQESAVVGKKCWFSGGRKIGLGGENPHLLLEKLAATGAAFRA